MKHVNVDVHQVTHLRYDWTCLACNAQTCLEVYDGDRAIQTISCRNCGTPLYRHGPGDYGTERPQ